MQDLYDVFLLDQATAMVFSELYDGDLRKQIEKGTIGLGCIWDGKPAGLLMFTVESDTCWLDWLKVSEDYRKRGIGSRLFDAFSDAVVRRDLAERFVTTVWDTESIFFLESRGFMFLEQKECFLYRANISEVIPLPQVKKSQRFRELSKITPEELRYLNNCLANIDGDMCVSLPLNKADYAEQSLFCIKDDKLSGVFLLSRNDESFNVDYAYARYPQVMLEMMSVVLEKFKAEGCDHYDLTATALNKETDLLLAKLFPTAEKTRIVQGEIFG